MKLAYLIDTDWIIHYLNGNEGIVGNLKELKIEGLSISVVSLAEVYEGIYYSTNPIDNEKGLNDFLTRVSILGIDNEICKVFGKERGRLRKTKNLIDDFDLLIASTCLCHKLTLLTNNRKHFEKIDGLKIISFP
ncbi:MAG: type II toxin-antitoxin system VapC family toxin [Candidatus Schekmanbacteria bacterium]|nr:type II toxin-antitoxin system VapC family toxin [Candidatus Schekmanbacteria bacterium]